MFPSVYQCAQESMMFEPHIFIPECLTFPWISAKITISVVENSKFIQCSGDLVFTFKIKQFLKLEVNARQLETAAQLFVVKCAAACIIRENLSTVCTM
jgi:hypothetical protein